MDDDEDETNALCCCEYYDRNNERYHMLQCCCNCVDFDVAFDRLICCRAVNRVNINGMLLTFQDRLRIPWHGGAKQITLDAILPIFVIPLLFGLAAVNLYTTIIIGITTVTFLSYFYYCIRHTTHRTRFFTMWSIWSVIYMLILFEKTVPLLEILPEENYALISLIIGATFCFYRTKVKSKENYVTQNFGNNSITRVDLPDIDEEEQTTILLDDDGDNHDDDDYDEHTNICQYCRKYVQTRTFHCLTCQSCIIKRDHHSHWLNCCIGGANHLIFYVGLWLSMLGLFLGANLTLTSVCHPLLLFTIFGINILLPDDCSEIYEQYEMSLAFIIAIYAFVWGLMLMGILIVQTFLIVRGVTLTECRKGVKTNRKRMLSNIRSFLFGKN